MALPVLARSQGQLTACKSNLKNIATALEMYSTDFDGLYPQDLGKLAPNYLRTIPTCPSAGVDTYSESYYHDLKPDLFAIHCSGNHHRPQDLLANQPAYSCTQGLSTLHQNDSYLTAEQCRRSLQATVDALESFHERNGTYPILLDDIDERPHNRSHAFTYWKNGPDAYVLRCEGALHV